jgi:predicted hydrocarbon binding protein
MLSEKKVKEILKIKGKIKGQSTRDNFRCIKALKGEEGLKAYNEAFKAINAPFAYETIKNSDTIPLSYDVLSLVVAADLFGWDGEGVKNFGRALGKVSFFEKTFIKYFISLEKFTKSLPDHWKRTTSEGELTLVELNEEKKYLIATLKDFDASIYYCQVLQGYFETLVGFAVSSDKISVEETKCLYKGDKYHEFLVKWE